MENIWQEWKNCNTRVEMLTQMYFEMVLGAGLYLEMLLICSGKQYSGTLRNNTKKFGQKSLI
jgi:hypothetical protein